MPVRFLVPVDERMGSVRTINYLIKYKEILKPVINLVTVIDFSNVQWHGIVPEFQEKILNTAEKIAQKTLDEAKKRFEDNDIYVENSYFLKGEAGKIICEEAEKLSVDMIAISPNNKSEITNIVFGSVTHYVVHHSTLPILLVK